MIHIQFSPQKIEYIPIHRGNINGWKPPDLSMDANYIPVEAPKFYLWALITNYVRVASPGGRYYELRIMLT
ncbi:MAG: hypothetical protein AAF915_19355, partial [Cyanobacteria bacterium P01_D01_bin.50]